MKKLILLLNISLLVISAKAQWTSNTALNTTIRDSAGATTPLMSTRLDGSTYVCWFETGPQNYELRMQLLDSSGYEMWTAGGIVVSNYPQNTALFRYDMKIDNEGNAVVAFQDMRTNNALNVVAYKVGVTGSLIWGPTGVQLIDPLSEEGLAPVIGIGANNYVYVAWNADSASKKWIACQSISPTGTIQWNQPYRVRDTVGSLKYSRAKLFPTGSSMQMLYAEEAGNFPGVTSTLYTQRFDSAGTNHFPSPVQVSTKTIPYFFFPEAIPDDNGGFFVAFNTSNPVNVSLNDVYVQYVDYNGTLWNSAGVEAANSTTEGKTCPASCYVSMTNEFWIVMQVQQTNSIVSVQRFDGSGNVMLGANGLVVFSQSGTDYIPYTISDAVNGIIVSAGFGGFGQVNLVAEKIDDLGNILWPGVTSALCSANSNKDDVAAGKFTNNNLVFVWQDDRNGSGVFAQNLHGDGTPGILNRINETTFAKTISLFPNPSNRFTIKFSDHSAKQINVTDMRGRIVFSESISANVDLYSPEIDIAGGLYVVSISGSDGRFVSMWNKMNE